MKTTRFDDAKRRLDAALGQLDSAATEAHTAETTSSPAETIGQPDRGGEHEFPHTSAPVQSSAALARLVVGVALLGLDALAAHAQAWEQAARVERGTPAAGGAGIDLPVRVLGEAHFRHGLIGWIFETEEELRPRGNPLDWLRSVVGHMSGSVFSVVFDALPRLGTRPTRSADPSEQDTARWVARGQAEEARSRAFAAVALDEIVNHAIPYLAAQPGVQRAVAELVRSPALDDAISAIVRSPAMQDAVTYLVGTQAMSEAIEIIARKPALVDLVQTQSLSIAGEMVEEVRERGVSADTVVEEFARRLLGRPPRSKLPSEAQGVFVSERSHRR